MQIINLIPDKIASIIASLQNGAGTKIKEVLPSNWLMASLTVLHIGMPDFSVPPFPGVTPATIFVPYCMLISASLEPADPIPWIIILLDWFNKTDIFSSTNSLMLWLLGLHLLQSHLLIYIQCLIQLRFFFHLRHWSLLVV